MPAMHALRKFANYRPSHARLPLQRELRADLVESGNLVVARHSHAEKSHVERDMSGESFTQLRKFDNQGAIDFVAEALKRAEAKRVARDADCSHRSVEKWKGRLVAPQLHNFLNACQTNPELKAAMRQLLAMEGEGDPDFQRALSDLVRAAQKARP